MCSIIGIEEKIDSKDLKKHFDTLTSRGPDAERFVEVRDKVLGFKRLSIMGPDISGMQPFELDGDYVVCNGEIYGFRKIKKDLEEKGYVFRSQSDCEVLLPLYRQFGTEMFKMLDAEFALIIFDKASGEFVAARDPIGIRPLYYGTLPSGKLAFASEPKALVGLASDILPFPPGHFYDKGKFTCYRDMTKVESYISGDIEEICKEIKQKLVAGIEKRLDSDTPVGYLLSGGLDSSLVCSVAARKSESPIKTFAIGMSEDAIDLKYAKQVADYIGSDHTEFLMSKEDVISSLDEIIRTLGTFDITTIRASVGMYLICKQIHEKTDTKVLLTGEISDELFGYKYTDFAPSAEEFQKEAQKRISEIHMYDVLRADRCISTHSLEARVPFGDLDFVSYVMSIDPELKLNKYGIGKYLLRHAFEGDYLPHSILYRQKAAFSDAVGHSMVDIIKEYAESIYSDEEFLKKSKKFTHVPPISKESLLYREIFEKYYPGQGQMIKDFWLPNKSWEGCDVSDPSARVLSNYGDSGK